MKTKIFDENIEKYEQWFEKNHYAYQSELLAVKKFLPAKGKGLEVGVGTARFAAPLGIKIGVEPSKKMAQLARKRAVDVVEAKAEKLPFSKSSFDYLLMVTTVCFVDDIKACFLEANRVLNPGGNLIIGFVDKETVLGKIYQKHKEESAFYKYAKFYSTDELVKLLDTCGFNNFEFSQTIFKKLEEIKDIEPVYEGYGKGSFVVIKAEKKSL